MLNSPTVLYLGSRILAAAGNLVAVAVFTRLAGPAEYGYFILIFSCATIVYGFATQWMRFAYFGVYQSHRVGEYAASLAKLLGGGIAGLATVLAGLALLGSLDPIFVLAVFTLVCGMTIYEAAFEVTRTRLEARSVALSMIMRACLTIALGSLTLWLGGGASSLAFAIALAHLIAAIPCMSPFTAMQLSHGSRASLLQILKYGWPLLLSFGVNAIGQSTDRLLLAHYAGLAALGPYGVLADVLRQSYSVFGEAIILSLITSAKQHANAGEIEASNRALQKAFNACLAAAMFVAAFFLVFGDLVVRILLGPEFIAQSHELVPIFAIAFAFLTMRNFYFAQVIYFTNASYLELVISALFVLVSVTLSILLVPHYGSLGAAISLMTACIVSCISFFAIGRLYYRLPIDLRGVVGISLMVMLFLLVAKFADKWLASNVAVLALQAVAFVTLGVITVHRFGLLHSMPTGLTATLDRIPTSADDTDRQMSLNLELHGPH